MAEAMKCGTYPIITNIGALSEVAGDNFASVVPIDGTRTPAKYEVTETFLNTFAEICCTALDYFEGDRTYYNQISKSLSNHISQKCDWKKIAHQWKVRGQLNTAQLFAAATGNSSFGYHGGGGPAPR